VYCMCEILGSHTGVGEGTSCLACDVVQVAGQVLAWRHSVTSQIP